MRSNKGFNLFTALIALMLLSITIIFIYNMVQTEENYLSLIETQSKTSDLLTIADLSRADAFNIFVVSFRERWAEHRSSSQNKVTLKRENIMLEWDDFVEYFANYIFFDRNFEEFFAQSVTQSLIYTNPPIGYAIDVPDYDRRRLSEIIGDAFRLSDEKIKVICESNTNCLGSLYFKIDTRDLPAGDYEDLPRITVSRLRDDEVIQRPVFARREYRIYLPWRGFQAFRTVRNFSLSPELEDKTNQEIRTGLVSSTGFFNPLIYNSFNSARVGVCDIDSCDLRTDLFKTASRDGFQEKCNNPQQTTVSSTPFNVSGTLVSLSGDHSYDLRNPGNSIRNIFEDLVETTVRNNINSRSVEIINSGGLELDGTIGNELNDIFVYDVSLISTHFITKQVPPSFVGGGSISNIQPVTFNPTQHNQAANLGFNLGADGNINYLIDEINSISVGPGALNTHLRCHKIQKINLLFKFEETNSQYIVSPGNTSIYVELEDNFPRYSFYHPSYPNPVPEGYFPFPLNFQTINLTNKNWTCNSYEGTGAGQSPACIPE